MADVLAKILKKKFVEGLNTQIIFYNDSKELSSELTVVERLIVWLTSSNDDDKKPDFIEFVAPDISRTEFVPYLLNFLRDETSHYLQQDLPSAATPSKVFLPASAKKSTAFQRTPVSEHTHPHRIPQFSSQNYESGPENRRIRLTQRTPSDDNDFSLTLNTPTPQHTHTAYKNSQWSGTSPIVASEEHSVRDSAERLKNSGSVQVKLETKRSRQRKNLADFMPAKAGGGSPNLSDISFGQQKRSGGKGRTPLKSITLMTENSLPVFNLDSSNDFPGIQKLANDASSGCTVITPSRRITTTLMSPSPVKLDISAGNAFKNATFVPAPANVMPRSVWAKAPESPANEQNMATNRLAAVSLCTDLAAADGTLASSSLKMNTGLPRPVLFEDAPKTRLLDSRLCGAGEIVNQFCEVFESPTGSSRIEKNQIAVVARRQNVTHERELGVLAEIYSSCIKEGLVPNIVMELYFAIQLLTARTPCNTASAQTVHVRLVMACDKVRIKLSLVVLYVVDDDDGDVYFSSIHNVVYFATRVFLQLISIVNLLDRTTVKLLADNPHIAEFAPPLKAVLLETCKYANVAVQPFNFSSHLGGVSFHAETDNRQNFTTEQLFHQFKTQRDLFYALLREWESNHAHSDWSMKYNQSTRIYQLVASNVELTNQIHFVRLFILQLIKVCFEPVMQSSSDGSRLSKNGHCVEDDQGLGSELNQLDPNKLKRLQERLVTPLSVGGDICPPPSFPGYQDFFRSFIAIAAHYRFNQLLAESLLDKILELTSGSCAGEIENDTADQRDRMLHNLTTLRVLGKFLGFVIFLPYQSSEIFEESMKQFCIKTRNQCVETVNVLDHIRQALDQRQLILCIAWVVDYLSMMDRLALQLDRFQALFSQLLHISICCSKLLATKAGTHATLLVVALLGWLFELQAFPGGQFFALDKSVKLIDLSNSSSLIESCAIDQRTLYCCCPNLGVIRCTLQDFAMGLASSGSNSIRKITPIAATSSVSDLGISSMHTRTRVISLQAQLEQSFFANHSPSLRRTVDFVSDRVMSNYIKNIQGTTQVSCLQKGRACALAEAATCVGIDHQQNANAKVDAVKRLEQTAIDLVQNMITECSVPSKNYCEPQVRSIISILCESLPSRVVEVVCSITTRNACQKSSVWLNKHITVDFVKKDLLSELDKQIRLLLTKGAPSSTPSSDGVFQDHSVFVLQTATRHSGHCRSPSEVLSVLKELMLCLLVSCETVKHSEVVVAVDSVEQLINNREGLLPLVAKDIGHYSLNVAYSIIFNRPDLWTNEIQNRLLELWLTKFNDSESLKSAICDKHLHCLKHSPHHKESLQVFSLYLQRLVEKNILTHECVTNYGFSVVAKQSVLHRCYEIPL